MFIIEYKQAGIRVMSQELTQSVLAHYTVSLLLPLPLVLLLPVWPHCITGVSVSSCIIILSLIIHWHCHWWSHCIADISQHNTKYITADKNRLTFI